MALTLQNEIFFEILVEKKNGKPYFEAGVKIKIMNKTQTHGAKKMRIVLMQNHGKKIFEKRSSPFEKQVGLISLEKIENGTEFTIRVLDVNHISYHYDPATQKFEIHFLSLKEEARVREENGNGKIKDRF